MKSSSFGISKLENGIATGFCSHFGAFVNQMYGIVGDKNWIYRGHSSMEWMLESTYLRLKKKLKQKGKDVSKEEILEKFKYASRGRIQSELRNSLTENEWWALGQHYGLATPLLDWTESPFVAAYFAFFSEQKDKKKSNERIIYGLDRHEIESNLFPQIEIVNSLTDYNLRLINQGGLFTKIKTDEDLEKFISENYKGNPTHCILQKIIIKEKPGDREKFLELLNKMNINHLTLFPDLTGTSNYCNLSFELK